MNMMPFKTCPPLQQFLALCQAHGVKPYLVGGAVRDLLHSETLSADLDFVVPPEWAKPLSEKLSEQLDAIWITLDDHYQIYRIILKDLTIDIAACIGQDIHEDLLRRDFTINAMAYDFETESLLDPTGGQEDLKHGILRIVSEKNMLEDPLRFLRLFRIGAELGFKNLDTDGVKRHGHCLLKVATERIHYEWMRLLSAPESHYYVEHMQQTGLLEYLFPEISAMHPIPENRYHHLPLLQHTLELLRQLEIHLKDLPEDIQKYLQSPWNPFIKRIAIVRLACLFHDVGKPATMSYDPDTDRYKFYGHDEVSAQLVYGIGIRMKWGKDLTDRVAQLCRWHLYPGNMLEPEMTAKAYRKFFRRVGPILSELIPLALADRFSAIGPDISKAELADKKAGLMGLWAKFKDYQAAETAPSSRLLSGQEIMTELNLKPGPEIGKIMHAVEEAYMNGEISTHEEALDWVKGLFKNC